MEQWNHDKLAEDLADHIGPIPFLNVFLGSPVNYSMASSTWVHSNLPDNLREEAITIGEPQRADLVKILPSYTKFTVSIYEIKVSRNDFLSDIRKDKWRGYLPHCNRFYFAVAEGVAKKQDIPEEAGLMIRGKKGWTTVKAAPANNREIPRITLMSLAFARQRQTVRERRSDRVLNAQGRWDRRKQLKVFGSQIADALAKQSNYLDATHDLKQAVKTIREAIINGLGLDLGERWPEWELEKLAQMIKEKSGQEAG